MSLSVIIGILSVVLTFGIAVFVHELGHYLFARLRGVGVEAFAIGMGPKIVSWNRGGTEYSLRWFPVGGFVRLHQMVRDEEQVEREDPEAMDADGVSRADSIGEKVHEDMAALYDKGLLTKLLVFGGGVFFNFLTAIAAMWLLYTIGFMQPVADALIAEVKPEGSFAKAGVLAGDTIVELNGEKVESLDNFFVILDAYDKKGAPRETFDLKLKRGAETVSASVPAFKPKDDASIAAFGKELEFETKPVIGGVVPYSPAEKAGVKIKDEIVEINGARILRWQDLQDKISASPNEAVILTIRRPDEKETVKVTVIPEPDSAEPTKGRIGVVPGASREALTRDSFITAGIKAPERTWTQLKRIAYANYDALRHMGAKDLKKNLGGPVAIGRQTYKVAQQGFTAALQWFITLNLILAIMNLLPIPVLDGGFIIISFLEALARRPIPARIMGPIYSTFAILFISFALLVTYWDILRTIF